MSNVTAKQVEAAKNKYEAMGLRIEQAKAKAGFKRGAGTIGELQKKKGDLYTAYLELKREFDAAEKAKTKVDESFFEEFEESLTAFVESRESLGVVGKSTTTKGSGTADDPFLGESAGRYTMVADMVDLAKKLDTSVHFVHEGCRYVATLRGIMEGDEFDSLDELDEAKVAPGTTKDEHYGAWVIRYDLRPVTGSKEYRGRAWHAKSEKTPPISLAGTSADDVRTRLISTIDSTKARKEIDPKKYVTIDFNVLTTKDIVGHKDAIYCDMEEIDGKPTLLIASTQPGGFQLAADRTALAQRGEHRTGQHAFRLRGDKAANAGLTHARYALGTPFDYTDGVTAFPLKFSSEVHPGEVIRLNEPGVTVAYPRDVVEGANEEGVFEGIFGKKEPTNCPPKFPEFNNVPEWMEDTVAYWAAERPEKMWMLFCPSSGDYLPLTIAAGTGERLFKENIQLYRNIKSRYPDAVATAKKNYTEYSRSLVGDNDDFTNEGIDYRGSKEVMIEGTARELFGALKEGMKDIVEDYAGRQVDASSTPAAPDSSKFTAAVGGMIEYAENVSFSGGKYGSPKTYRMFIKVGGGIDQGVKDEIQEEFTELVSVMTGQPASNTLFTTDGYRFIFGSEDGTNYGGYGVRIDKKDPPANLGGDKPVSEGKNPVSKAKVRPVKDRNDVTKYEVCNSNGVTVKGGMSKEEANRYLIANRASLNLDESVQKRGTSIPKETYSDYREFEKAARAIARKDYTQIMFRPSETENAEYLVITDNTPSGERIIGKWNHDTDTGTIENNMNWGKWDEDQEITEIKQNPGETDPKLTGPLRCCEGKESQVSESNSGKISVNMTQMNRWKVDQDNVKYYDSIMKTKGKVQSLDLRPYKNFLDEFNIFYTAPLGESKHGINKRVKIVKGPAAGKTGTVGEVRHGAFKGAKKEYTIDIDGGGNVRCTADQLRLVKDEPVTESTNADEMKQLTTKLKAAKTDAAREAIKLDIRKLKGEMELRAADRKATRAPIKVSETVTEAAVGFRKGQVVYNQAGEKCKIVAVDKNWDSVKYTKLDLPGSLFQAGMSSISATPPANRPTSTTAKPDDPKTREIKELLANGASPEEVADIMRMPVSKIVTYMESVEQSKNEPVTEEGLGRAMMAAAAIGGAPGLASYLPKEPSINVDGVKTRISTPQSADAARNHSTIKLIDGKPYQVWSVKGHQYAWPVDSNNKAVKEGYWDEVMSKVEKDREARKDKPFEKNPAAHDENGDYKGDKDLDGKPVTESPSVKQLIKTTKRKLDPNARSKINQMANVADDEAGARVMSRQADPKSAYRNADRLRKLAFEPGKMLGSNAKEVEEGWKGAVAGAALVGATVAGIAHSPKIEVGGQTYDKAMSYVTVPADAKTVNVKGEKYKVWAQNPESSRNKGPGPKEMHLYKKIDEAIKFTKGFGSETGHMPGAVIRDHEMQGAPKITPGVTWFKNRAAWETAAQKVNSAVYDDNAEIMSTGQFCEYTITDEPFARWISSSTSGWVKVPTPKERAFQQSQVSEGWKSKAAAVATAAALAAGPAAGITVNPARVIDARGNTAADPYKNPPKATPKKVKVDATTMAAPTVKPPTKVVEAGKKGMSGHAKEMAAQKKRYDLEQDRAAAKREREEGETFHFGNAVVTKKGEK